MSVYLHEFLNFKLRQRLSIESNEFTVKKNIHSKFNKFYRKDKKATWCWIQCWKSASKIDHTLNYNYVNQTAKTAILECDISDHFLIFVFFLNMKHLKGKPAQVMWIKELQIAFQYNSLTKSFMKQIGQKLRLCTIWM